MSSLEERLEEARKRVTLLETEIAAAEKPREIMEQKYCIDGDCTAFDHASYSYIAAGAVVSEHDKDRVCEEQKIRQILNVITREENDKENWKADFNDNNQEKNFLEYNQSHERWQLNYSLSGQIFGIETCSEKTGEKLIELLNNGAGILGVNE